MATLWFQYGSTADGEPWYFEVDEGTAEHQNLVKNGAQLVDAPEGQAVALVGGETLGDLTVKQLRAVAKQRGVEVPPKATKDVLVELLEAGSDDEPQDDGEDESSDDDVDGETLGE